MLFFIISFLFVSHAAVHAESDQDHAIYKTYAECLRCHPRANPTHSMDSVMRRIPESLPLNPGREISCITCHDCKSGKCYLRTAKTAELCRLCHTCTQGMACLIGVAHLGDSKMIEVKASDCLRCHESFTDKTITGDVGHKINILYTLKRGYNIVIDKRVVLVDGKITCLSCHNPYKDEKGRLVMNNEKARLCLTCHNK